jgi:chaperonin GroEL (HSP60 family)
LKHQKEFAKIMINNPKDYDSFIDSEWKLVQEKLDSIVKLKFDLILDSKVIGDLPTQYFTQHNITNISRIPPELMKLIVESVNGNLQTSLESISNEENVGGCELYEERTIGDGRYCIISGCEQTNHVTIILRGSSEELLKEVF